MNRFIKSSWKDISQRFARVDLKLATIINEISPPDNYFLYNAFYPYGAYILESGCFQVHNRNNQLVSITDSSIANKIKEELIYTGTMPVGIVLENSIESFFLPKNTGIPTAASFFTPGGMISLWGMLETPQSYQVGPHWNVTAGARTICMLPKISEKISHHRLYKKYQLKLPSPNRLEQHWQIFKHLANHPIFDMPWNTEMLFFSKKWFQHQGDKAWSEFYRYLYQKLWLSTPFRRNQYIFEYAFSTAQQIRNLKPNPYLADTFRHLISVGTGEAPGLRPAVNNIAAPITSLQKVYIEDYGLKKYLPIIMHLHHFSWEEPDPVYYSLEMPTTTVFSPRSSQAASKMVDMRELKHILEIFFLETLKGNLMIEKTPLYSLAKNISYDFYHSDSDQYNEISNAAHLVKLDSNLQKTCYQHKELAFPEFSPFFRGCIAVSKQHKDID